MPPPRPARRHLRRHRRRPRRAGSGSGWRASGIDPTSTLPTAEAATRTLGPYDRIIATCSVPTIPWDWHEQLVDGGAVLVDLKIGLHAGNLVLLRRRRDRLEGTFLPKWAGFMAARATDSAPVRPQHRRGPIQHESSTRIDPDPWAGLVPWFLAQIGQPAIAGLSRTGPHLAITRFTAADGAWCEIDPADHAGERTVREGGPRRLWSTVEAPHRRWTTCGKPGWERLGITVRSNGQHDLWLDTSTTQLTVVIDATDRLPSSVPP